MRRQLQSASFVRTSCISILVRFFAINSTRSRNFDGWYFLFASAHSRTAETRSKVSRTVLQHYEATRDSRAAFWSQQVNSKHGDKLDLSESMTAYVGSCAPVPYTCKRCGTRKIISQARRLVTAKRPCMNCDPPNRVVATSADVKTRFEWFVEQAQKVHGQQFDYSIACDRYINNITPIPIICTKCNNMHFQQPGNHLQGHGCQICNAHLRGDSLLKVASSTLSNRIHRFIEQSQAVHPNLYDYSHVHETYKTISSTVKLICRSCQNQFWVHALQHVHFGLGCNSCSLSKRADQCIESMRAQHPDIDYSQVKASFSNFHSQVQLRCRSCQHTFKRPPSVHLRAIHSCPKCKIFPRKSVL